MRCVLITPDCGGLSDKRADDDLEATTYVVLLKRAGLTPSSYMSGYGLNLQDKSDKRHL